MFDDQSQSARASLAALAPLKVRVASLFYGRLLTIAPQLRSLLAAEPAAQGDQLMSTLTLVAAGLDRLESFVPKLQVLGRAYAVRGVTEDDYALVGETLLWALEQALGPALTPGGRQVWRDACELISEAMIAAARRVPERCAARVAAA